MELRGKALEAKAGNEVNYRGADHLAAELQGKGVELDRHLSAQDAADVLAFSALLSDSLGPATLWITWAERGNYVNYTRVRTSRPAQGAPDRGLTRRPRLAGPPRRRPTHRTRRSR